MHNVGQINHTHQHTHAGTQDERNVTAEVVFHRIEKEEREGVVTST